MHCLLQEQSRCRTTTDGISENAVHSTQTPARIGNSRRDRYPRHSPHFGDVVTRVSDRREGVGRAVQGVGRKARG